MQNNELSLRIISAAFLLVSGFIFISYLPILPFFIITLLLNAGANYEYGRALKQKGTPISMLSLQLAPAAPLAGLFFYWEGLKSLSYLLLFVSILTIAVSSWHNRRHDPKLIRWYLLPIIWIVVPFISLIALRFLVAQEIGAKLILFVILISAANDVFAYFGGKKFGRHKLAPVISPKKTIEGSLFGYLGGILVGIAFGLVFDEFEIGLKMVIITIAIVLSAQLGDLIESMFKRFCEIKDSGTIIPGHGGILDRFDAYLVSLPLFCTITVFGGAPLTH